MILLLLGCPEDPATAPVPAPAPAPVAAPAAAAPTHPATTMAAPASAPARSVPAAKAPAKCGPAPAMPASNACVGATVLTCGSSVTGTTEGGTSQLANPRYVQAFCFPASVHDHDGPERAYRLDVPDHQEATVTLTSACVDLDVMVMAWSDGDRCPGDAELISECEADVDRGGGSLKIDVFNSRSYTVVVDGAAGVAGPYTLGVTCKPIRRPGDP